MNFYPNIHFEFHIFYKEQLPTLLCVVFKQRISLRAGVQPHFYLDEAIGCEGTGLKILKCLAEHELCDFFLVCQILLHKFMCKMGETSGLVTFF